MEEQQINLLDTSAYNRLLKRVITAQSKSELYFCPVCEKKSRFGFFGNPPRRNAQCLHCGSLERHRLTWLYFERMTNLFDKNPKSMLHIAPERCIGSLLSEKLGQSYISADIRKRRAMLQMDITKIQFPDNSFDVIYCSHVLEHVQDDKRALAEFFRVLKHGGWAIILVPMSERLVTFEDSTIKDPAQRLLLFGQEDHVRCYGQDFVERLQNVGFSIKLSRPSDFLSSSELNGMSITHAAGDIYYCTKNST